MPHHPCWDASGGDHAPGQGPPGDAGEEAEGARVLCTASLGCWGHQRPLGWVAVTFQLKSPFAFFGLALAAGSRGF